MSWAPAQDAQFGTPFTTPLGVPRCDCCCTGTFQATVRCNGDGYNEVLLKWWPMPGDADLWKLEERHNTTGTFAPTDAWSTVVDDYTDPVTETPRQFLYDEDEASSGSPIAQGNYFQFKLTNKGTGCQYTIATWLSGGTIVPIRTNVNCFCRVGNCCYNVASLLTYTLSIPEITSDDDLAVYAANGVLGGDGTGTEWDPAYWKPRYRQRFNDFVRTASRAMRWTGVACGAWGTQDPDLTNGAASSTPIIASSGVITAVSSTEVTIDLGMPAPTLPFPITGAVITLNGATVPWTSLAAGQYVTWTSCTVGGAIYVDAVTTTTFPAPHTGCPSIPAVPAVLTRDTSLGSTDGAGNWTLEVQWNFRNSFAEQAWCPQKYDFWINIASAGAVPPSPPGVGEQVQPNCHVDLAGGTCCAASATSIPIRVFFQMTNSGGCGETYEGVNIMYADTTMDVSLAVSQNHACRTEAGNCIRSPSECDDEGGCP